MLRHHIPQPYLWILLWLILALLLLMAEAILFPQPAIAFVNHIKETLETVFLQVFQLVK